MEVEIRRGPEHDGRRGIYAVILDQVADARDQNDSEGQAVQDSEQCHVIDNHEDTTKPLAQEEVPGQVARISISHDGEYATAVCMAAENPLPGDVGGETAARMP
jgi:holo-[acyl-carrier protein] synthase